jgi:2-oxoglutarate dehydrogenase E1 component
VRAFQVRGHLLSDLDPLGLTPRNETAGAELDIKTFGFTDADLDREFDLGVLPHIKGFLGPDRGRGTLRYLLGRLRETYCSSIGWEYMHIPSVEQCNWLRERVCSQPTRHDTRSAQCFIVQSI